MNQIKDSRSRDFRNQPVRIEWIDYFRYFGILLMVMGHIGYGSVFDKWLHGFHMPMFFFISGVLYISVAEKTNFSNGGKLRYIGSYALKKARKILPPYLCVGVMSYILWLLKNAQYDNFLSPLHSLLWDNSDGLPYTGALWFLTAFFFSAIIYFIIDVAFASMKNNVIWKTVAAVAFGILGCVLRVRMPWSMNASFTGVGLMHAGWLLHKLVLKNDVAKTPRTAVLHDIAVILAGGV